MSVCMHCTRVKRGKVGMRFFPPSRSAAGLRRIELRVPRRTKRERH